MQDLISVIIPVYNEEQTIIDTLEHVRSLHGSPEIIVVDGGSQDNTYRLALTGADRVLQTRQGRGYQLNRGAEVARGDIYLFLHSDSRLETGALKAIYQAMENQGVIGGCFSIRIDGQHWLLKYISWTSNLRAKYLGLMFGDQGIFVKKEVFEEIGGFPDLVLMEDWEFSRKLSRTRGELTVLPETIYTSARRFEQGGVWKTFWLMQKIKLLYMLGVEPKKLKKMYREAR